MDSQVRNYGIGRSALQGEHPEVPPDPWRHLEGAPFPIQQTPVFECFVISNATLADDAEVAVDVLDEGDGTATGLKVAIIGVRPA